MKIIIKYKIVLLIGLVASIVIAALFLYSSNAQNLKQKELTIVINGDKRYITLTSSLDGNLGVFYAGTIMIKISNGLHILEISGEDIQTEFNSVDLTKTNKKTITVNLTSKKEVEKVVRSDFEGLDSIQVDDCTYFANKIWMSCITSDGDTREQNIYKYEQGNWRYITSGSWLTGDDIAGLDAPEELLRYLEK